MLTELLSNGHPMKPAEGSHTLVFSKFLASLALSVASFLTTCNFYIN